MTHSIVHRGKRDLINVFQNRDYIDLHFFMSVVFLVCLFVFVFDHSQPDFSKCC